MSASAKERLQLNQRMVRERDRARSRELMRLLGYGALIAAPLLGYVWQRVDFLRVSYKVEKLQKRLQELNEENNQRTVERSTLMGHARIEGMARKQLGMIDPAADDIHRVRMIDGTIREVKGSVEAGVITVPGLKQPRLKETPR
jgi:cell division protein FtsL